LKRKPKLAALAEAQGMSKAALFEDMAKESRHQLDGMG
jgi:hypothetical protein